MEYEEYKNLVHFPENKTMHILVRESLLGTKKKVKLPFRILSCVMKQI